MKKLYTVLSFAVLLTCSFGRLAMATNYECTAMQELDWDQGHLKENKKLEHARIRFNDQNGDMWIAGKPKSNFGPMPYRVLQNSDGELFAVFDAADNSPVIGSSFRLRTWDKKTGIIFLLYNSSVYPLILTGKCHLYKGDIPIIDRCSEPFHSTALSCPVKTNQPKDQGSKRSE